MCPSCHGEVESIAHFLLFCAVYEDARKCLFEKMINIVDNWITMNNDVQIELLLRGYGSTSNKTKTNVIIFLNVQVYLHATRRFF